MLTYFQNNLWNVRDPFAVSGDAHAHCKGGFGVELHPGGGVELPKRSVPGISRAELQLAANLKLYPFLHREVRCGAHESLDLAVTKSQGYGADRS